MADLNGVVVATVGSSKVTLNDLVFHLKTNLEQHVLDDTIQEAIMKDAAAELGISITDGDLQAAADDFRRSNGLLSAKETHEWLEEHGFSLEDMERKLEDDLLRDRLRQKLATQDKVLKVYTENISDFQRVKAGVITVDKESTANEIVTQLKEGEADFVQLALRHSSSPDVQSNGGYRGRCFRKDLPDAVDAKVFSDSAPDLVGPVQAEGQYYVVKIYEKMKSEMDDLVRATCEKTIVDTYIQERAAAKNVKIHVLE